MSGPTVVMLAGTLRPSPLREAINVPVLCLPLGPDRTLLDAWIRVLAAVDAVGDVRVVGNNERDVERFQQAIAMSEVEHSGEVRTAAETTSWRGAGGILFDVTGDVPPETTIIAIEANVLPPFDLHPLLEAMNPPTVGVVGVCGVDEPAGVYAFRRETFEHVPKVGYFDLKEQFLPKLAEEKAEVRTARLGDARIRLRDREGYLAATVRRFAQHGNGTLSVARDASVSGSAILYGACVIESGAVIEDGAVVHDSVVLRGATIGGGAVVSESVVGPLASVLPRSRHLRDIVAPGRRWVRTR